MISRRIEADGGLESVLVLRMLAAHAVPGLEAVDEAAARYERVIEGPDGPYLISVVVDDRGVVLRSADLDPAEQARTDVLVRRWFDLDGDLGPVNRGWAPIRCWRRWSPLDPIASPRPPDAVRGRDRHGARATGLGRRGPNVRRPALAAYGRRGPAA